MRVFLTGATGFIGAAIIPELLAHGHQVIGASRTDAGAARVIAAGATAYRGTLEDPDGLARGAADADGVIHCAFDHDFSKFAANCEKDARVIAALGAALAGSDRPLVVTSGTGLGNPALGVAATEDVFANPVGNPREASERAAAALLASGVNVSVLRLAQIHDTTKQGLVTPLIAVARERGLSAYVGDGTNRYPAAHVSDTARLYRLALEHGEPGARWHAADEEGVKVGEIAAAIGRGLGVPVRALTPDEAAAHFGWLGHFVAMDIPASSAITRARLGWDPTGPGLLADLERMDYAAA